MPCLENLESALECPVDRRVLDVREKGGRLMSAQVQATLQLNYPGSGHVRAHHLQRIRSRPYLLGDGRFSFQGSINFGGINSLLTLTSCAIIPARLRQWLGFKGHAVAPPAPHSPVVKKRNDQPPGEASPFCYRLVRVAGFIVGNNLCERKALATPSMVCGQGFSAFRALS